MTPAEIEAGDGRTARRRRPRRQYWDAEVFVGTDEPVPHRRRFKSSLGATEVSVDFRFIAFVAGYVALGLLFRAGGSPAWITAGYTGLEIALVGLVVHEVGHAVAARRCGQTVLWFALSAPSSAVAPFPAGERYSPRTLAVVALGGPAATLVLAVGFLAAWRLVGGHWGLTFLVAGGVNVVALANLIPFAAKSPVGGAKAATDGALTVRAFRAARSGVAPDGA